MNDDLKHILEIVSDIQENMATKGELRGVEESLQAQILENGRAIARNREAIERLEEKVDGMQGYAKKIDGVMTRVSVLEQKVGV